MLVRGGIRLLRCNWMIRGWIVDGCGIVRWIGFGGGIDGGGGLCVDRK